MVDSNSAWGDDDYSIIGMKIVLERFIARGLLVGAVKGYSNGNDTQNTFNSLSTQSAKELAKCLLRLQRSSHVTFASQHRFTWRVPMP